MQVMLRRWMVASPYYLVFNNDDGDGGTDGNNGDNKAGDNKAGDNKAVEETVPKFTQADVNKMLAENKKNLQSQVTSQIKELEILRRSASLSEKEKVDLSKRIEDLSNSMLSKEELAAKEKERLLGESKRTQEQLSSERDFYKTLYETSTIEREIIDEASRQEAYSPSQMVELLKPRSRIVEVLDADSKPIKGKYVTKIKIDDTDKEGKPITLDLSVAEALKRMKERAADFGNLFKSGVNGGLGDGKGRATGKELDPKTIAQDPKRFREWRKTRGY